MSSPTISQHTAFVPPSGSFLAGKDKGLRQLIFSLFVLLVLLHHGFVFLGFYGMDDINYARYAAKLASGEGLRIQTTDHFELRWLAIYATAFFYRIFGINDFSSAAFGIITVLLTGYLILRLLARAPLMVLGLALLLFFLDYHVLFTTHRIWPDSAVMLLLLAAYYCYQQAGSGKRSAGYPVIFSIALVLAMLAKETVILFLPLLIFLLVRDVAARRLRAFWLPAILVSALLCFGYIVFFKLTTGNWWYRYTVLQLNTTATDCDFGNLPLLYTLRRIGYQLWQAFLLNGDMIVLLMGVCGLLYRRQIMPGRQEREFSLAFFILLLSANFMSISFTAYVPLCHDPRHFLFLIPFAAIVGARLLTAYFVAPAKFWVLPALFAGATCILFITKGGEMKFVYLLITLVLFVPLLAGKTALQMPYRTLAPFLLAACLLVRPAYDLYKNRFYYFDDHKKLIQTVFADPRAEAAVYTANELTAELSEYFLGFHTGAVQFRWMGAVHKSQSGSPAPAHRGQEPPAATPLPQEHRRAVPVEQESAGTAMAGSENRISASSPVVYFLLNRETDPLAAERTDRLLLVEPHLLKEVRRQGPVILYRVNNAGGLERLWQHIYR